MARLVVDVSDNNTIDTTDKKLKKLNNTGGKVEKKVGNLKLVTKDFGKNASAAIASVDGPLGGISSRISSLTTLFTTGSVAVTAFGIAAAGVSAALAIGVKNADEYEVNLKRLEGTLKATGNAAGFTAKQLQSQAEELALATLTSVNEVQKAQAKLTTFNRVVGSAFTQTIKLSQDLAEAGFGTIEQNAIQLGKALQDPVNGISALTRVGVTFSELQKDQIKNAIQQNDVFSAQGIILDALQTQVGGVAESVATGTLSGSLDTLGQRFADLTRAMSDYVGATDKASSIIDQIARGMQRVTEEINGSSKAAELFDKNLENVFRLKRAEDYLSKLKEGTSEYKLASMAVEGLRKQIEKNKEEILTAAAEENKAREENFKAYEAGEARKKKIADELAEENQKRLDIQAEKEAKLAAVQQASIDSRVESIRQSTLTESELLSEQLDKKLTLISQSSLSEQQQQDITLDLWADYYDQLGELDDKYTKAKDKNSKDQAAAQKATLQDQLSSLSYFVSTSQQLLGEGNDFYKALAITQTTISTYQAAVEAYKSTASIPVVGPFLAPAAAATAVSFGLAQVANIQAERAQGGSVSSGSAYVVGERGREVFVPETNGSIISNSDLTNSGGTNLNVNVYNQSDSKVTTKQNASGGVDIYVTKEELPSLMANVQSNRDSAFTRTQKSMRQQGLI